MNDLLKQNVAAYILKQSHPVTKKTIADAFQIKAQQRVALKAILKQLLNENKISKAGSKYIGYQPNHQSQKLEKPKKNDRSQSNANTVIGLIEASNGHFTFTPAERKIRECFAVLNSQNLELSDGQVIVAQINKNKSRSMATAIKIIGHIKDVNIFSKMALAQYQLTEEFSDKAMQQASAASLPDEHTREDLRHVPLVTIDDETAKDFDDAVWAQPDTNPKNVGGWHAIVAIADVAYYVAPEDALDKEAKSRGNSVYLPDKVIPMLPEGLSNEMCSLKPQEDRACLAVHMHFDAQGNMLDYRFCRALIRSHARLTYNIVQNLLDAPQKDHLLYPHILNLHKAYLALKKERTQRGSLELNLPESKLAIDSDGKFSQIGVRARLVAHEIIEELMIAANVAAAVFLEKKQKNFLYRCHDLPSQEKLDALLQFLRNAKIPCKLQPKASVHDLNKIITSVQEGAYNSIVNELILRSQAQAYYTPNNIGHFGLGLAKYCHFTSPIRRYSDIIVHRAIIQCLDNANNLESHSLQILEDLGEHLSICERHATQAERDTKDRYVALYLQNQVGKKFNVSITGVTKFGLFVTIKDINATGLLLAANLPDDYYVFDEKTMSLKARRKNKVFSLGQAIQVKLIKASTLTGALEFVLA